MKPDCKEIERQLAESRREFWAADATINNLELKLAEMAERIANAESKCNALAAENAWMKEYLVVEETPATDAFLDEVRAQGVEMYADNLDNVAGDAERGGFDYAVKFLRSEASSVRLFASQVRKGASSAKVHDSEPLTDNTNQQFESLSRGDK